MKALSSSHEGGKPVDGGGSKNRRKSFHVGMVAHKDGTATETSDFDDNNNNKGATNRRRKTMFGGVMAGAGATAPQTNSKKQQISNNTSSPSKENTPTKNMGETAPSVAAAAAPQTSSKKPQMSPAKGKTPTKNRVDIGDAASEYFLVGKVFSAKKKKDSSFILELEDGAMNSSFRGYDGSQLSAADSSFLSSDSSATNSSCTAPDRFNQSDPTELSAATFVSQRLSLLAGKNSNNDLAGKNSNNDVPIAAPSPRQENRHITIDEVVLQQKQKGADGGADVALPRKPLGVVNQNNNKHRNSLPPTATRPSESAVGALAKQANGNDNNNKRRESWNGGTSMAAPVAASNFTLSGQKKMDADTPLTSVTKNMRSLSASIRQRRLKREEDRRLSAGSSNNGDATITTNLDPSMLLPPAEADSQSKMLLPPSLSQGVGPVRAAPSSEEHATTKLSASMNLPKPSPIQKSTIEKGEEEKSKVSSNKKSNQPNQNNSIDSSIASSSIRTSSKVLDASKRSLGELFDGTDSTKTNKDNNDTEDAGELGPSFFEEDKNGEHSVRTKNSDATSDEVDCTICSSRNSSVSRASSLSSATGMSKVSKHSCSSIARKNNSFRPRPDAIAFERSISPLNAAATSPFRYDGKRSPGLRKSLTPTKLKQSPRRYSAPKTRSAEKKRREREEAERQRQKSQEEEAAVSTENSRTTQQNLFGAPIRSAASPADSVAKRRQEEQPEQNQASSSQHHTSDLISVDSTASNTSGAEKRRLGQEQIQGSDTSTENKKENASSDFSSPRRHTSVLNSADSPARNTRGAQKRRLEEKRSISKSHSGENAIKRKREDDANVDSRNELSQTMQPEADDMNLDDSVAVQSQKRSRSSASSLSSALRPRGSSKKAKNVGFSSPEFQTFNQTSPSASVTPGKLGLRRKDTEDTTTKFEPETATCLEEATDASLSPPSKEDAGSTPFASKKANCTEARVDGAVSLEQLGDDSDSPKVEDASKPPPPLQPLPSTADSQMSIDSSSSDEELDEEHTGTVAMDRDMDALIRSEEAAATSTKKTSSLQNLDEEEEEEDITVEFPKNLDNYLNGADVENFEVLATATATATTKKSPENSTKEPSNSSLQKQGEEEDGTQAFNMDMDEYLNGAGGENIEAAATKTKTPPEINSKEPLNPSLEEEDKTEEFDMDIDKYLRGAGGESFLQSSDSKSSRRRSSLSTSRFSLAPSGRPSLSSSCPSQSERDISEPCVIDKQTQLSQQSSISTDESSEDEREEMVFDLKNREIVNAFQLTKATFNDQSDILCTLISETITNPSASTMMDGMLMSVCDSLHKAVDMGLNLDDLFEGDHPPEVYLVLQRALRFGSSPELQNKVQKMVRAVRRSEAEELDSWIVSVAERLHEELRGKAEEMREKITETENHMKVVNDRYEKLSTLETKTARKARRKSLNRRKTNALKLEEEIADLEAALSEAQSNLESVTKKHGLVNDVVASVSQAKALTRDVSAAKSQAESSESSYAIISGLGKFRPSLLNENRVQFSYVGPCKAACFVVDFNLATAGVVTCRATVQPNLFSRQVKRRPQKSASLFFEARVNALCESASSQHLENPSQIGAFLRQLEWAVCRLEQTGSEISMLQRRYKARLASGRAVESSSIHLEVEFSSHTGKATLLATFELNPAYPFSSVNVQFDVLHGEVDMDGLQKILIKNAKPAFGYLSRTCDMIAAFLH